MNNSNILNDIYNIILKRKKEMPENSYVSTIMKKGIDQILKKIGEEISEVIIACKNNDRKEIIHEVADLWFHSLVMLGYQNINPNQIFDELKKRLK